MRKKLTYFPAINEWMRFICLYSHGLSVLHAKSYSVGATD